MAQYINFQAHDNMDEWLGWMDALVASCLECIQVCLRVNYTLMHCNCWAVAKVL